MKSIERIEVRVVSPIDDSQFACKGNRVRESILVRFRYGNVRYQGRVVAIRNHIPWSPAWRDRSQNPKPPVEFRNYVSIERHSLSIAIAEFFGRHDGTGFLFRHFETTLRKLLDEWRAVAESA